MSEDAHPKSGDETFAADEKQKPAGVAVAVLIIILVTAALAGVLYLGAQLFGFPFAPLDLSDLVARTGILPWTQPAGSLSASAPGDLAQTMQATQWLLPLGLFTFVALVLGLLCYALTTRLGRVSGLLAGALFAALAVYAGITTGNSQLPLVVSTLWQVTWFLLWGLALSYAFRKLARAASDANSRQELAAGGGVARRQFLLQFGAGAAAIATLSAAAGASLVEKSSVKELQQTLPMISPELMEAQRQLFSNFRRFAVVRGGAESAEGSNVLALGAEFPDRNYVSVWIGGRSPIVIYEYLQTAAAAFGSEDDGDAGIYWLDD